MRRLSDEAPVVNTTISAQDYVTNTTHPNNGDEGGSATFTLNPDLATEMQRLLDQAALSTPSSSSEPVTDAGPTDNLSEVPQEEGRSLRSAGKSLQWNPVMGNDNVILPE